MEVTPCEDAIVRSQGSRNALVGPDDDSLQLGAGLDPGSWPLVADDIIDGDEATPNKQWVDISGDVSPSGLWFYQIAAYNHRCPSEGPR